MLFPHLKLDPTEVQRDQVLGFVRNLILSGRMAPGTRVPSTRELARQWHTHVPVVNAAYRALEKEGLLTLRHGKGTFVRQREPKLTCVAVYETAGALRDSLFHQAMQAVLKEELAAAGLEMDFWLDPRPAARQHEPWLPLVRAAAHREFQALIATCCSLPRLQWQRRLPVPTAFVAAANIPHAVGADLGQFAELSVQTLAQQGCRSVGVIFPGAVTRPDGSPHEFTSFFERLMERVGELGLTVRNEWMRVPTANVGNGPGTERFGHDEFLRLWAQPARPEGLIVYPDTTVRGVILGLLEKQVRVPADLKLVLHKNEAVELYCPLPVTFAVFSERKLARALIAQVQQQFRGETGQSILLPFDAVSNTGS